MAMLHCFRGILLAALLLAWNQAAPAREYHVALTGDDAHDGTQNAPLRHIQEAANRAQPGDQIIVHAGTYRERVTPPRGGTSDSSRIVYQGENGAVIKGSEKIEGWEEISTGVWKVTLPDGFFGAYNPYRDLITGDWFNDNGRPHHTGEVFLNGKSLYEVETLDKVRNPEPMKGSLDPEGSTYTWYCESDADGITIWANFHDEDPNEELTEMTVRDSCFYPDAPGRNYITVRSFEMCQAATQWAAPTAEQIGLLGAHWSKGWIIEDNVIHDSKCSGITLGKERGTGHNVWSKDPSKDGATHYNEVIERALAIGWSKENIGSHAVRRNTVYNCEQAGICGSMGAAFSQVYENNVHDVWTKRMFSGAEIAGIKFHGAVDTVIRNNRLHNVRRGIWLDWMAQGTRVTANLFTDNDGDDLFVEVNHGPFVVDNNLFLSKSVSLRNWSEGGAYVHNLFAGQFVAGTATRMTPYLLPHATQVAGHSTIKGGDDRYYNNIFCGAGESADAKAAYGLAVFNNDKVYPVMAKGNLYLSGAVPYRGEENPVVEPRFSPKLEFKDRGGAPTLSITLPESMLTINSWEVTDALGTARVSNANFENDNGSHVALSEDCRGVSRRGSRVVPGPFAALKPGKNTIPLTQSSLAQN